MVPAEFVSWPPVTDSERATKAPLVETDAGAEILEWRVHVADDLLGDNRELQRVFYHYIRIKVFNEKGKEQTATIDLPYREPGAILEVSGRTIREDGSIVELDRKSVYKRDLVRANGLKQKAVSFAMPGVDVGSILEYRWKQTEDDNRFRYLRIQFQREFPVRKVTWFVKPLPNLVSHENMFLLPFNSKPSPVHPGNDGYSFTTLENVPAARTEPFAPTQPNVEPWALLFYKEGESKQPDKFWNEEGRRVWKDSRDLTKSNEDLKKAAAEAVAQAKSDDEKAAALVMLVRRKVKNILDPEVMQADRANYFSHLPKDRQRNSAEIFQSGIGTPAEIGIVFLALAEQAGIEARPVIMSSRVEARFNPKATPEMYFMSDRAVSVRAGNSWKILDPGSRLTAPGIIPWQNEATWALVCDPKEPALLVTPPASPEASTELRTARLKLGRDGSLEGDVEETLTGHSAEEQRQIHARQSPAQREEAVHDRVVRMFPDAEVTDIKYQNADDAASPLIVRYHLRAPLFAQVTGKRILFQPNAFRRAERSPFTAAERRLPIEFPYAWKEIDQIHILLPDGFSLDNADSPGLLNLGKPGSYKFAMAVTSDGQPDLYVDRELTFGSEGTLFFPRDSYASLKKAFDEIESRDGHTLSLKAK